MTSRWCFIICIVALIVQNCNGESSSQDISEQTKTSVQRTTNVSTFILQPTSLIQYSRLSATVNAWRDVTISSLEPGVVKHVYKDVSHTVKRGDHLALLNLELLQAASIEAEAQLKFQTYNYERSQKLFDEGSISEQTHFATEYDYNRAKSTAQMLKHRLAYGHIRAPFSGHIATRHITMGQLVAQGGPTFRIVQTDSLRIKAWVAENEVIDFQKGNALTFTLDALPKQIFSGTIAFIGPAADANRRVFPIEVHFANPNYAIRPGMIGTLKAVRQTYNNVLVIPREAILERETGPVTFIVINDTAHLRALVLGPSEADRTVVKQGLSIGDQVILKGGRDLIDGDRVTITQTDAIQ